MNEEETRLYEATQKEMAELGIPPRAEEVVETPEAEPEATPEVEPEEETKQVPAKEVIDPKEYKDFKATLREELQKDFDEKLLKMKEEMSKTIPSGDKTESLDEESRALAKELDFYEE